MWTSKVSMCSEKPIYAPPHLSQCFLPLKQFQWQWKYCLEDVWRSQKRISLFNLHFQKVWRKYCFPSPAPSKTSSWLLRWSKKQWLQYIKKKKKRDQSTGGGTCSNNAVTEIWQVCVTLLLQCNVEFCLVSSMAQGQELLHTTVSSTFTEKADYLWYNCTEVSWQIHQRKTTVHERPGLCYGRLWNNSLIHIIIILEILTLILYSSETPLLLPLCLIFRVVLMFFKEKKKKGGSMVKNWFPSVLILLFKPVSWMNRGKCKWYYELMKKAKTGWIMHSKKDTMHMIHFQ